MDGKIEFGPVIQKILADRKYRGADIPFYFCEGSDNTLLVITTHAWNASLLRREFNRVSYLISSYPIQFKGNYYQFIVERFGGF